MNKTIKLTNGEINKIAILLSQPDSILNSKDKKYPMQLLWNIDGNFEKIKGIAEKYRKADIEIRQKYVDDEYSVEIKTPEGNIDRRLKPEFVSQFSSELEELAEVENEITIATIPFEKLEDYEFSGVDIQSIKFMIDNPVETE